MLRYNAEFFGRKSEFLLSLGQERKLAYNDGPPYKFAYSRTALRYGLIAAGLKAGDRMLVPGFICESAVEPLKRLGIQPVYYQVDSELRPVWSTFDKEVNSSVKAFMIVHYFGQPQNLDKCISFCSSHSLLLIEDNAHGFGSSFKGRPLGTFGAVGFSSPRKSFSIRNGAYLYLSEEYKIDLTSLKLTSSRIESRKSRLLKKIRKLPLFGWVIEERNLIKKYLERKNNNSKYGSQKFYREAPIQNDYGMDLVNDLYIKSQNIDEVKKKRCLIYNILQNWAEQKSLKPVFSKLSNEAVPLIFAVWTDSKTESLSWYEMGSKMGIDIHSWPTLPEELVDNDGVEMRLWEKLVCFPIHQDMDIKKLEERLGRL